LPPAARRAILRGNGKTRSRKPASYFWGGAVNAVTVKQPNKYRVLGAWRWLAFALLPMGALLAQQSQPAQLQQQQQTPPTQQRDAAPPAKDSQGDQDAPAKNTAALPRGKKLYLKDGSFQIVRSYERNGDTVKYYSLESSSWEEIPATLVDWDATAKAEADQAKQQKEFEEQVRTRESRQNAVEVLDVDASLEVAPGVILPDDPGMYALAAKKVTALTEVKTDIKLDKGRVAEKIISGVPAVIPTRHTMEIKGKHASARLPEGELEFYYRVAPDADEPEMLLLRLTEKPDMRVVETISTNMVGENNENQKTIKLLKWETAKDVYRYTLAQSVPAGEYALMLVLPDDQLNPFVWDFGVDHPKQK
jgi:hypothetical protein